MLGQAIAGFSDGTFDVKIIDSFDTDLAPFLARFPVLKNYTIEKRVLPKTGVCYLIVAPMAASAMGCATIMGSSTQFMPINSTPSDAAIEITDEKGATAFKGTTPTGVMLAKSDGSYFGGKKYTVTISKAGFEPQSIPVTSSANAWYIGGNIILGGLIGWLIVDPLNGHMYNLTRDSIRAKFEGKAAHNNTSTNGSITIVLIEQVPQELRSKMVRIF